MGVIGQKFPQHGEISLSDSPENSPARLVHAVLQAKARRMPHPGITTPSTCLLDS